MQYKSVLSFVGFFALVSSFSHPLLAQVANGPWRSWSPSFTTQQRGSGSVSGGSFTLSSSAASGEQRAERRYQTYTSGSRQFQGNVRVNSLGGDRVSLCQVFNDPSGPWSMVAVRKPGTLYQVQGGAALSGYSIGSTARVNLVVYTGSDTMAVYINGSQRQTRSGGAGAYYFKLGAYRTASGRGPASVNWSGVSFFQK